MASLKLTLNELLIRVSDYLGMGNGVPTDTDDLAKCKDIVARGYRQFLYPVDVRTGDAYEWSFLLRGVVRCCDPDLTADIGELNDPIRIQYSQAFDDILQLAYVAIPIIIRKH